MKNWSGKNLCFECAKKLGTNINIGRKHKGRCHRCHSEQTVFKVTAMPIIVASGEGVCPECAHPEGAHAAFCPRSELEILKREREEIVKVLECVAHYDPEKSLSDQLEQILRQLPKGDREEKDL
ncbi:MAG: hypothetical protein SCI25_10665 [Desulfuromonadales bacterium]|nr:hypothetical protein [Desulfuromonadales bacterium]MDW7757374.1 hypothetical protein [Desulfuromonadales bacterium]